MTRTERKAAAQAKRNEYVDRVAEMYTSVDFTNDDGVIVLCDKLIQFIDTRKPATDLDALKYALRAVPEAAAEFMLPHAESIIEHYNLSAGDLKVLINPITFVTHRTIVLEMVKSLRDIHASTPKATVTL